MFSKKFVVEVQGFDFFLLTWGQNREIGKMIMHSMEEDGSVEPIEIPIDGILDLHTFSPREVKTLVPEYLLACRKLGILTVRIIHGKGTGTLRRTVHALLNKLPEVVDFKTGDLDSGSWGATLVTLAPL